MNRDIEFRIRRLAKNADESGHTLYIYYECLHEDGTWKYSVDRQLWMTGVDGVMTEEQTVFQGKDQWIGLQDRVGRNVYQGDILRVKANKEGYGSTSYEGIVEVTNQVCGYSFRLISPSMKEMDEQRIPWDSSSLWHVDEPEYIEIIGNIYTDSHLLKEVK